MDKTRCKDIKDDCHIGCKCITCLINENNSCYCIRGSGLSFNDTVEGCNNYKEDWIKVIKYG